MERSIDREKVGKGLCDAIGLIHGYVPKRFWGYGEQACRDAIALLKQQEVVKPINMENDIVYGLSEISLYLSNIGKDDFAQTIEDACKKLELLKEQEPMLVKTDMYGNAYCPWCSTEKTIEMGVQKLHPGTHFCPYCGKKVKWE